MFHGHSISRLALFQINMVPPLCAPTLFVCLSSCSFLKKYRKVKLGFGGAVPRGRRLLTRLVCACGLWCFYSCYFVFVNSFWSIVMWMATMLHLACMWLIIMGLWPTNGLCLQPPQPFTAAPGRLTYSRDLLSGLRGPYSEPANAFLCANNIPLEIVRGP